ncbi:MAG: purine-binding chemotaxis protein CheW [bacterium]|jgi:purine-binding chemotaxis protein CheW
MVQGFPYQTIQVVSFKLDGVDYGIDLFKVKEIVDMQQVNSIPRSPDFIEGVINLRGDVFPLIDLRKRLGVTAGDYSNCKIIIMILGKKKKGVGFIVDSISSVVRLDSDHISKVPPVKLENINQEFMLGVAEVSEGEMLVLVDLEHVFTAKESVFLSGVK